LLAGDGSPAAALRGNTPDLAYLGRPGSVLNDIKPWRSSTTWGTHLGAQEGELGLEWLLPTARGGSARRRAYSGRYGWLRATTFGAKGPGRGSAAHRRRPIARSGLRLTEHRAAERGSAGRGSGCWDVEAAEGEGEEQLRLRREGGWQPQRAGRPATGAAHPAAVAVRSNPSAGGFLEARGNSGAGQRALRTRRREPRGGGAAHGQRQGGRPAGEKTEERNERGRGC
jgi:hypothetical protein